METTLHAPDYEGSESAVEEEEETWTRDMGREYVDVDREHVPSPPFDVTDWCLLALAAVMFILFVLIMQKVAVAIGVGLLCVGTCAYAFVEAQASRGPAKMALYGVSALAIASFFFWSFKFVFHLPKAKSSIGCGGVFFEGDFGNRSGPAPHDEL